MFIKFRKNLKKAQSTAEYAVLIGLVIGAVVAMQVYVRRSINAKIRDTSNFMTNQGGDIGTGITLGTNVQYEPYYLSREQKRDLTRDRTEKHVFQGDAESTVGKTITDQSVVQYRYEAEITE